MYLSLPDSDRPCARQLLAFEAQGISWHFTLKGELGSWWRSEDAVLARQELGVLGVVHLEALGSLQLSDVGLQDIIVVLLLRALLQVAAAASALQQLLNNVFIPHSLLGFEHFDHLVGEGLEFMALEDHAAVDGQILDCFIGVGVLHHLPLFVF